MDETIVFEKTERGQREIAQPGGELQPRLRRILIMIDGQKPIGDLAPLTRPGEIEVIVEALLRGGYIVASGGEPAETQAQLVGNAAEAAPAIGATNFEDVRQRAMRAVQDMLGPPGDPLAIEIERCKTPEQMRALLAKAQKIVGQFLGPARAEEFRRKTGAVPNP